MTSQLPTLSHLSSAFSPSIFAHIIQHEHINYFHVSELAMNSYTYLTLYILLSSTWRDILCPPGLPSSSHSSSSLCQNTAAPGLPCPSHTGSPLLVTRKLPPYIASSLVAASVPHLPSSSQHQPHDYNSVDVKIFAELMHEQI